MMKRIITCVCVFIVLMSQVCLADKVNSDTKRNSSSNKATSTYTDAYGNRYEGYFVNGKIIKGVLTFPDGTRYEGDFVDFQPNGKGILTSTDGRYEGDFANGNMHGKGIFTNADGRYEGDFVNGSMHGKGIFTNAYFTLEGDFIDGKFEGKGVKTFVDGARYEGDFIDSKFEGKGILTYASGDYYKGYFLNDKLHGYGTDYAKDGTILRQGKWKNNNFIMFVTFNEENPPNDVPNQAIQLLIDDSMDIQSAYKVGMNRQEWRSLYLKLVKDEGKFTAKYPNSLYSKDISKLMLYYSTADLAWSSFVKGDNNVARELIQNGMSMAENQQKELIQSLE